MPQHDALAILLDNLKAAQGTPVLRSDAREPVPGRPGEWRQPFTPADEGAGRRRNQAKVMALRAFLGIPGADVGDISQQDYEEAGADVERRQHALITAKSQADILPEQVRGQYSVQAAKERARTDRAQLQEDRQTFQSEQGELNRAAAAERQQAALNAPMVPIMDPATGLATWAPRAQAGGQRTGGSATERTAIQEGGGTLDNIRDVIAQGDAIQWKGFGPAAGLRNLGYKFLHMGSEAEDNLRVVAQKVRADVMFGSGGKQLTNTEKAIATSYLADIYTHPESAPTKWRAVLKIFERAQARRTGIPVQANADEAEWEDVAR